MWFFRSQQPKGEAESTSPLAQDAKGASMYGTAALAPSPDVAEVLRRRFSWHERLEMAVISVGGQYAALGVMALTVYTSSGLFVTCDSRQQPLAIAFACECTKSSMRCFVLFAMIVSLLIALRQIARQRIYYEMLRRGALLDFETVTPFHDDKSVDQFLVFLKAVVVKYVAHSCVFLAFLASAYDTENQLLPLSKYVEEDPVAARLLLSQMAIVLEASAAEAVERGRHIPEGVETCTSEESYACLLAASTQVPLHVDEAGSLSMAQLLLENARVEKYAKFIAEMWPARALLDPRIKDDNSLRFKRVWYAVNGCAIPLTFLVLLFFLRQVRNDLEDVRKGQTEDVGGLAVAFLYALATLQLLTYIWDLLFIPMKSLHRAASA
eukprot:s618_g2.t1